MRSSYFIKLIAVLIIFLSSGQLKAQSQSSILSDTVSETNASLRRTQTSAVNFDVNKLNTIVSTCMSRGITSIQFIFAKIRTQDTTMYFNRNHVPQSYHASMVNKPTILIKVPRSAFDLALNEDPLNNDLVKKMKGGGLFFVDNNFGGVLMVSAYLYFDAGTICPPPDGCN